jgi:Invasion associated locus B (IalB) protein
MRLLLALALLLIAAPASARDSLGVFGDWGAFRDPQVPRCYAIAAASGEASQGYASIGNWPDEAVRGQVHLRLSRPLRTGTQARLTIAGRSFTLTSRGSDAWATNRQGDAAIVAAMRAASTMQVTGRDRQGRAFTDRYSLEGAATALDAASVGCARG